MRRLGINLGSVRLGINLGSVHLVCIGKRNTPRDLSSSTYRSASQPDFVANFGVVLPYETNNAVFQIRTLWDFPWDPMGNPPQDPMGKPLWD